MSNRPDPLRRLVGGLLVAVGLMVTVSSGLCTVAVGMSGGRNSGEMIPLALMFGAVPFALGVLMLAGGWLLSTPPKDRSDG